LDCFFCGENSYEKVNGILKEIYRILKPRGVYIFISYGNPDRRLIHLQKQEDFDWEIRVEKIIKMRQPAGDGETQTEELAEPDY
jgi:EEF1A lysine methyltransferase 4